MVSQSITPIKGRVVRVVTLDTCGNPVTGASSSQVVQGFISVKYTPVYEDGQEFFQRAADGTPCVNQKDPPILKRYELEVTLCAFNADMLTVVSGARLLTSGGATGVGNAWSEGLVSNRFSLELWQNVSGNAACSASGVPQYVYWAWPNVGNVQMLDYTAEDGISQMKFKAETQAAGPLWGDGPGSTTWLPAATTLATTEHIAWNITTTAPPVATAGAVILS